MTTTITTRVGIIGGGPAGLMAAGLNHAALAASSVLQRGYDAGVTGANLAEARLNTATVGPDTFGKLFTLALDENPYAQPLYVPNVAFPGLGTHTVLYVATMNDSVYAFDADASPCVKAYSHGLARLVD